MSHQHPAVAAGPVDAVAEAWEKARREAEALKKNKFASKKGAGGGGGGGGGSFQDSFQESPTGGRSSAAAAAPPPAWGADSLSGGGPGGGGRAALATPAVAEKVRQVAEQEMGRCVLRMG